MKRLMSILCLGGMMSILPATAQEFKLGPEGYFQNQGVNVMGFDDIYPEGHQGGVSLIMHGHRVATNGDIRLEPTPLVERKERHSRHRRFPWDQRFPRYQRRQARSRHPVT